MKLFSFFIFIIMVGLLMAQNNDLIAFVLKSNDFKDEGAIPEKLTCDGDNISPQLQWEDAPSSTKSFVLIVEDPDAPQDEPFVHWILYNIPFNIQEIKQNITSEELNALGIGQGYNHLNAHKYGGPCPPRTDQVHHYYFTLYALSKKLDIKEHKALTKDYLIELIGDSIIGKAQIIGLYERNRA